MIMESIFNFLLSYFSIIFLANVKSEISKSSLRKDGWMNLADFLHAITYSGKVKS